VRKTREVFKLLVLGNSKCGKTSFIERYCNDRFSDEYNITIGADYKKKVLDYDEQTEVRLQLWDIAGQDRFANLTRPYYRNAIGAVVVCDVTRLQTLEAAREWKRELDDKVTVEVANADGSVTLSRIPVILIANKCDLIDGVGDALRIGALIENLCAEASFEKWFITSAKADENVSEGMQYLVDSIVGRFGANAASNAAANAIISGGGGGGGGDDAATTAAVADTAVSPPRATADVSFRRSSTSAVQAKSNTNYNASPGLASPPIPQKRPLRFGTSVGNLSFNAGGGSDGNTNTNNSYSGASTGSTRGGVTARVVSHSGAVGGGIRLGVDDPRVIQSGCC
jgi:Ras-related protein Rab-32